MDDRPLLIAEPRVISFEVVDIAKQLVIVFEVSQLRSIRVIDSVLDVLRLSLLVQLPEERINPFPLLHLHELLRLDVSAHSLQAELVRKILNGLLVVNQPSVAVPDVLYLHSLLIFVVESFAILKDGYEFR